MHIMYLNNYKVLIGKQSKQVRRLYSGVKLRIGDTCLCVDIHRSFVL